MNPTPTRKVTIGAFASACSVVLGWLLTIFTPYNPPTEVSGAIAVIIYFVVALYVPEDSSEESPPT